MRTSWFLRFIITAALLVAAAPMLRADPPSNILYGGLLAKKPPTPQAPDVRAPPAAWPRLDAGSVVCSTEADLLRRAAAMRGEPSEPADCRPITAPTAVTIVARHGPGRTEVQVTGQNGGPGWTDAWLPATPPRGTATSARYP